MSFDDVDAILILRMKDLMNCGNWLLNDFISHFVGLLINVQICITTSTSADLDQILSWMFYHKVMGVMTFFLFVEGKAASPKVSNVLESIPVS